MAVSSSVAPPAERVVRHLASWGLVGGPDEPVALDVAATIDVDRLAFHHRVSSVAIAALDDGALHGATVVSRLRSLLQQSERRLLRQTLMAEADLVRVTRALQQHDIDVRVLKGLATAHLDYEDPALRSTSDVDVLVRPDQLGRATDALAPLVDSQRSIPDRRRRHTERYGKDRTLRLVDGGWLDLHRMVAPAYWGLSIDHDRFFGDGTRFQVAGTEMIALTHEQRFIHSILHAGYTADVKLQSFRDVIVLSSAFDRDPMEVLTQPWLSPVRGLLKLGIDRLTAVLGVDPSMASGLRQSHVSTHERLALRTRSLRGNRDHWSGTLALSAWRWPGYLLPLAAPSREYLDWHGRTRFGHLASARQALRRRDNDA